MQNSSAAGQNDAVTAVMYWLCLTLTVILAAAVVIMGMLHVTFLDIFTQPCVIRKHTGLCCPGCGFTHAVVCLVSGSLRESFLAHPAVPVGALMDVVFVGSQTAERLSRGAVKGLRFRLVYVYILLGIIILQCLIKNLALFL